MSSYCTVYLCRHGQTTANRDRILQGSSDYPLTDLGVSEAGKAGRALRRVEFSKIMSSDLKRAARTCVLMQEQNDVAMEAQPAQELTASLRECGFGLREGRSRDLTHEELVAQIAQEQGISPSEVEDGSETHESILARQKAFLKSLRGVVGNVLAVAHGAYIKNFLKNLVPGIETPPRIGNCAVSVLQVEFSGDEHMPLVTADPARVNVERHMAEDSFLF
jgi:uncharacterized phosphatase